MGTKTSMFRRRAISIGISGAALLGAVQLGGCADLMQRSSIAPDWFNAKAQEVKGTGYPELSNVPQTRTSTETQAEWEAAAAVAEAEAAQANRKQAFLEDIDKDLGDKPATFPTEEEIRAMAAQMRAKVEEAEAAVRE